MSVDIASVKTVGNYNVAIGVGGGIFKQPVTYDYSSNLENGTMRTVVGNVEKLTLAKAIWAHVDLPSGEDIYAAICTAAVSEREDGYPGDDYIGEYITTEVRPFHADSTITRQWVRIELKPVILQAGRWYRLLIASHASPSGTIWQPDYNQGTFGAAELYWRGMQDWHDEHSETTGWPKIEFNNGGPEPNAIALEYEDVPTPTNRLVRTNLSTDAAAPVMGMVPRLLSNRNIELDFQSAADFDNNFVNGYANEWHYAGAGYIETTSGEQAGAYHRQQRLHPNQWAEAVINKPGADTDQGGVAVRYAEDSNDYYCLVAVDVNNSGGVVLRRFDAGVEQQLAQYTDIQDPNGQIHFRLEARNVGDDVELRCYSRGTLVGTYLDTHANRKLSGPHAGVAIWGGGGRVWNFRAGSLPEIGNQTRQLPVETAAAAAVATSVQGAIPRQIPTKVKRVAGTQTFTNSTSDSQLTLEIPPDADTIIVDIAGYVSADRFLDHLSFTDYDLATALMDFIWVAQGNYDNGGATNPPECTSYLMTKSHPTWPGPGQHNLHWYTETGNSWVEGGAVVVSYYKNVDQADPIGDGSREWNTDLYADLDASQVYGQPDVRRRWWEKDNGGQSTFGARLPGVLPGDMGHAITYDYLEPSEKDLIDMGWWDKVGFVQNFNSATIQVWDSNERPHRVALPAEIYSGVAYLLKAKPISTAWIPAIEAGRPVVVGYAPHSYNSADITRTITLTIPVNANAAVVFVGGYRATTVDATTATLDGGAMTLLHTIYNGTDGQYAGAWVMYSDDANWPGAGIHSVVTNIDGYSQIHAFGVALANVDIDNPVIESGSSTGTATNLTDTLASEDDALLIAGAAYYDGTAEEADVGADGTVLAHDPNGATSSSFIAWTEDGTGDTDTIETEGNTLHNAMIAIAFRAMETAAAPVTSVQGVAPRQIPSPLSRGLMSAFVPSGNTFVDVMSGAVGEIQNTPYGVVDENGRGVNFNTSSSESIRFTKGSSLRKSFDQLLNGDSYTISVKFRIGDGYPGTGEMRILAFASSTDNQPIVDFTVSNANVQVFIRETNNNIHIDTGGVADDGEVHVAHLVVHREQNVSTIYVDGKSVTTNTSPTFSGHWDTVDQFALGSLWRAAETHFFEGVIYGAYIWDRALSADEIAHHAG